MQAAPSGQLTNVAEAPPAYFDLEMEGLQLREASTVADFRAAAYLRAASFYRCLEAPV